MSEMSDVSGPGVSSRGAEGSEAGQLAGRQVTLFGFVFLGHQLGSFLGVWLGGFLYDRTGSYDLVWWLSIALGLLAALLHWPTDERAVARLRTQS
jgi:predicted MFS family arabinose efflux permease